MVWNPGKMGIFMGELLACRRVVATQIFLEFSPRKFGEMIQFDEHIFQMGWWKTTNEFSTKKLSFA